ncbi:beta-galactosidase GalB [Roseimarinus sediminis]|uniref:beta-galactosidase GalB n=1 Tax=Roseimarinus sediminis TaxID=1610899 RepID=UPI003D25EE1E
MMNLRVYPSVLLTLLFFSLFMLPGCKQDNSTSIESPRKRELINEGWHFFRYENMAVADELIYDVKPGDIDYKDDKDADSRPTEALELVVDREVLKPWILPTANEFIKDSAAHYSRPEGNPGSDFPFVQNDFDDSSWEQLDLPHDWAIAGPFLEGWDAEVGGGMGRLPSHGVAWYRKKIIISESDTAKSVFLEVDGAMSYAMVWFNGKLVGGWPYGYNSFQLDLTPWVKPGGDNQLAIRIDNPPNSSRWYPGGGIYRNVWLITCNKVHIAQWGTCISTDNVTVNSAKVNVEVDIANDETEAREVTLYTEIFELDEKGNKKGKPVLKLGPLKVEVKKGQRAKAFIQGSIENPKLWGPLPNQEPNLYVAVSRLETNGEIADRHETQFGIRSLNFDPEKGLFVNGEHIILKGVNQHHDLGALGAAWNYRAAERQLEVLRELGTNAIRIAHNPPAPELLELTDKMGFLVIDEIFDVWERKKTPLDFHLIFPEWYEADTRSFIRRDRNHPSVIAWSIGNEVGEQYTGEAGAEVGKRLHTIAKDEDPTRPTTASFNYAKPHMPLPAVMDLISLNYQGEGIRNAPAYAHLKGINTEPLYPDFHKALPEKLIISSENAAAVSSRGEFVFPVTSGISAPVSDTTGGDPVKLHVSAYELYTAPFGSSADKVFRSLDQHPFVAGGFVWSGWDYLGEPTPYYLARSSYFGLIDLAGFPKERFYLYQSYWRPDYPMAHILPHWNWPGREGQVTPVHVFTSGDEAELFLNGESLGRKKKGAYEYRLRWDNVRYAPGTLKVLVYKNGNSWAEDVVETTGDPVALQLEADRSTIASDGKDLSFITVTLLDAEGRVVPDADNEIEIKIEGTGVLLATDNGDPTDMTEFPSAVRKAFNGLALAIVSAEKGVSGTFTVSAHSHGLKGQSITIVAK